MSDSTNVKINPRYVDWSPEREDETGYDPEIAVFDSLESLSALSASRDFGPHDSSNPLWVDPKDWKDVARENDRLKIWPENWRNRYTHQARRRSSHECTCHAFLQNFEIAWNRQAMSKDFAIWVSALSLYSRANPSRWGGSYMQKTLGIGVEEGILPDNDGPAGPGTQKNKFEHTLKNSSGDGIWIAEREFPNNWELTARHFRATEYINIRHWHEHVCLVLRGYCVSNGRRGHAIPHVQIVWGQNGDLYSKASDSYDRHILDSERLIKEGVGGAYAIVSTTIPSDWTRPAAEQSLNLAI
jgi:hypothetical protein